MSPSPTRSLALALLLSACGGTAPSELHCIGFTEDVDLTTPAHALDPSVWTGRDGTRAVQAEWSDGVFEQITVQVTLDATQATKTTHAPTAPEYEQACADRGAQHRAPAHIRWTFEDGTIIEWQDQAFLDGAIEQYADSWDASAWTVRADWLSGEAPRHESVQASLRWHTDGTVTGSLFTLPLATDTAVDTADPRDDGQHDDILRF